MSDTKGIQLHEMSWAELTPLLDKAKRLHQGFLDVGVPANFSIRFTHGLCQWPCIKFVSEEQKLEVRFDISRYDHVYGGQGLDLKATSFSSLEDILVSVERHLDLIRVDQINVLEGRIKKDMERINQIQATEQHDALAEAEKPDDTGTFR